MDTDDVAIGIGLGSFHERPPEPAELFRYVERADELGIDSIWMPDHVISERPERYRQDVIPTIASSKGVLRLQGLPNGFS